MVARNSFDRFGLAHLYLTPVAQINSIRWD
jgi:hypothetical protein